MFNFQLTKPLADALGELAEKQGKTLSAYIKDVLMAHIAKQQHDDEVSREIESNGRAS